MRNLTPVIDNELGIYVWQMPNGEYIEDGDGNFMHIPSRYGDLKRISALRDAARYWGVEKGGKAVFLSGARAVTSDEFDDQNARAAQGLLPDPYDVGANLDSLKYKKAVGEEIVGIE